MTTPCRESCPALGPFGLGDKVVSLKHKPIMEVVAIFGIWRECSWKIADGKTLRDIFLAADLWDVGDVIRVRQSA